MPEDIPVDTEPEEQPAPTLEDELPHSSVPTPPVAEQPAPEEPAPEAEPTAAAPDAPGGEPAPSTEQQPTDMVQFMDQEMTRAEAQALIEFRTWAQANPQVVAQIGDVLSGRARIAPLEEPAPTPPQPGPGASPAAALTEDELADLSPGVRARLERLDLLEQRFSTFEQQTSQDIQARNLAAIDAASRSFGQKYDLDAPSVAGLTTQLVQTQLLPSFIQAAAGDVERGTLEALEAVYFRNPQNRQRELDRITKSNKDIETRKRNASKIAGSSGAIPRSPEPVPQTPAARVEAMAKDIAASFRNE